MCNCNPCGRQRAGRACCRRVCGREQPVDSGRRVSAAWQDYYGVCCACSRTMSRYNGCDSCCNDRPDCCCNNCRS